MANALVRQVRQVDELLKMHIPNVVERMQIIGKYYPWYGETTLYSRHAAPEELLSSQPSEAALRVAAKPLGLSPSKIEKLVHRKKTN